LEKDRLRSDIFEVNSQENMLRKQINMDKILKNQLHGKGYLSDTGDDESNDDDDNDDDKHHYNDEMDLARSNMSIKRKSFFKGPPGKRLNEELGEEHRCRDVWNRRFLKPLSQSRIEQFKERLNNYSD
jgi:hypothetical protein